jgi:hypothetical protein
MERVFKEHPPLLWEPVSQNPMEIKLANMRAAIASGADPNELDGTKMPRVGRPLHYAISSLAFVNYETLKSNLPIIELLLESGADPRLSALKEVSALDEVSSWLSAFDKDGKNWAPEDIALKPFYEAAYKAMKKVADKLNCKFA